MNILTSLLGSLFGIEAQDNQSATIGALQQQVNTLTVSNKKKTTYIVLLTIGLIGTAISTIILALRK